MFDKVMIPIVGIVENMSYFICDGCGKNHEIFSRGGAQRAGRAIQHSLFGRNSDHASLREGGDKGIPSLIQDPTSEVSRSFLAIAAKLAGQLSIASNRRREFKD
jgi:ATP-binding protein involved in chromosome partitioning